MPRHFSILVDKHDYRKEYPILVGGVIAFTPNQYIAVNGFSNVYWGW
jgi:beta-1,4-galactosyltransferase 1